MPTALRKQSFSRARLTSIKIGNCFFYITNLLYWANFLKTHLWSTFKTPHPPPPQSWPLRSNAFLHSHLIQFIIADPPSVHSAVRGDKSPLPNMDAFLFPWICAALPWGYCTPIHPPPPLHTYKDTLTPSSTITPHSGWVKKYLGLFIVSPLPWVEMAFRQDGAERSHSGGHILLRVMLIECKKKKKLYSNESRDLQGRY